MEGPWESNRAEAENGELLSVEENQEGTVKEHEEVKVVTARNDNCGERFLHCLSQVPCASLIAWIILLVGLGGVTGSLLIGMQKTRELLDSKELLWFLEYSVAGVVAGMFVIGTILLCVGHISTDPTSRHVFHSTKRNLCAQGLNIFMLILTYILGVVWILVTSIMTVPLMYLLLLIIIKDNIQLPSINLVNYGFQNRTLEGGEFEDFVIDGKQLIISYIVSYASSLLIVISMIHFMIAISANLTHLKDTRLATLNAYADAKDDTRNSKHSIVDTTM
ncbi:hypothetical protein KUTeg_024811 [Tegillarca granosa]|uniref:Neuronal membrane glycoprotein M6-b n=1 Tax=Tegillarca granosa TaxID=220873 RepID=A0ABQ9DZF1_TEGGR|nr:hypothetical protein KUTeg_024811 [Tegillarca granosa]